MHSPEREVIERLKRARKVLVVSGAGISAESGVPTFRGAGGYWRQFRAEDLASPQGFARDPKTVWEWYQERRNILKKVKPNPGHYALAKLEKRCNVLVVTQNVDGLHQTAGSMNVVEIHGSIWIDRCTRDGKEFISRDLGDMPLPRTCECGALLRPGVVWFGETLPRGPMNTIGEFLAGDPVDVSLIVGTSALFPYIGDWGLAPRERGALVVEINPESTPLSSEVDISLRGPSGEVLPRLIG
jgi:NAD-dependent protein deacetylase/lipoamidase